MTELQSDLRQLEGEAVHVLREVAGQFERSALLFSGGKDSVVLAELARRAFAPGKIPFPFLHVDTGHNFPETLRFRDSFIERCGVQLIIASVSQALESGLAREEEGPRPSRNLAQTATLLEAIRAHGFDCCVGGARRDEEKARAKERVFSHRDRHGQWDPKNQRAEVWLLFNGRKRPGEHFRVFPLSDWTELDVWRYIQARGLEVPCLYFSHRREIVRSQGVLLAHSPWVKPLERECVETLSVRFRTVGDMTCSGAIESQARTVAEVIDEVTCVQVAERGGRADDRRSESAMEERKRQGYF